METLQPRYDIIKFGRNERLADRFVESEVHTLESKGQNCVVAVTLEINNPWHHAREYGRQIITTLVREFVRSESSSNLIRFEQSLKATNHIIQQAKEKLNASVNCVVTLLIDEEVHFAVVGNTRVLLWRGDELADVTSDGSVNDDQFSSVTSGDLNGNEWLMLANQPFSDFLSNVEPDVWGDDDTEVVSAAVVELCPASERDLFSGILLRYAPDKVHRELTILWDTMEHLTPIKLPKFKLPHIPTPGTRAIFAGSGLEAWQVIVSLVSKISRLRSRRSAGQDVGEIKRNIRLPKLRLPSFKPRSRVQIIAAVILVGLIVFGVQTLVSRVRSSKNEPKAPNLAEQLVSTAIGERVVFLNDNFSLEQYDNLSDDQKQTFAQALSAESISPLVVDNLVSELQTPIAAIDSVNEVLAVVDTEGQVWLVKDGQTIKVEQTLKIANPTSIAIVAEDRILVSDRAGNIWLLDATPAQPQNVPLQAAISGGEKSIQKYGRNIYVYHLDSNSIYRQVNFDKDLNGLKIFLKNDLLTTPIIDLTINGKVVSIDNGGKVSIFAAGKLESQQLTVPVTTKLRLSSVESNSKIFALSGKVLYVADDKGALQQSIFPLVDSVTDIALDGPGQTLWLSTEKKVYRIKI